MLVRCIVFFTICCILLAACFIGPECHRKLSALLHILLEMAVTVAVFVIICFEIDCQASRIHWHIFINQALLSHFVHAMLCVFATHLLYECGMCALNSGLITSSGCNIPINASSYDYKVAFLSS
jgi:hypothetical protein